MRTLARNPEPQTRAVALARLRARLRRAGIEAADQESTWLLAHALGVPPTGLGVSLTSGVLTAREAAAVEALATRREGREPLQLILGDVPFHHATLETAPGVFIPRPETEALVEAVCRELAGSGGRVAAADAGKLLDWGTGTGAIAVALLRALPGWHGVAADRSPRALSLAQQNAARNGLEARLRVLEADFAATPPVRFPGGPFDVVVSNPPYIRSGDLPGLMPEVRDHDPREALDGGEDGLDAFRSLALGISSWLRPGGLLALEIGADQADNVLGLVFPHTPDARVLPDLAGRPRIVIGTMRGDGP